MNWSLQKIYTLEAEMGGLFSIKKPKMAGGVAQLVAPAYKAQDSRFKLQYQKKNK
jgi:hypothetical protein